MLTPKEEKFCQNLEVKRMSQRKAYVDAYPHSKKWQPTTVDVKACQLANKDNIMIRRKELRQEQAEIISEEAKWTREDAFNNLQWLIEKAKTEAEYTGELTSPVVSALLNSIKELNNIFAINGASSNKGSLEDILNAVKGVSDD